MCHWWENVSRFGYVCCARDMTECIDSLLTFVYMDWILIYTYVVIICTFIYLLIEETLFIVKSINSSSLFYIHSKCKRIMFFSLPMCRIAFNLSSFVRRQYLYNIKERHDIVIWKPRDACFSIHRPPYPEIYNR